MKALQIVNFGGPTAMKLSELKIPTRLGTEVLIKVSAAGVAYPDLLLSKGQYQYLPDLPFTPGSEIAGVVVETPANSALAPGQRVAAYCHIGGYQEYVSVEQDRVFPLPDGVTFAQGASLPINFLTAHFALHTRIRILPTDTVLVHGAGGGLGLASIQLARAIGAEVIAVASDAPKQALAKSAGANYVIGVEGFLQEVKSITNGRGVDIVVDPVGGDRVTDSLRSLAPLGKLLILGFTSGEIPTVKTNRLLLNNIEVVGVGWGAYAMVHPGFMSEQWMQISELIQSGDLVPLTPTCCDLSDIPHILSGLVDRTFTGKAVATWASS